MILFVFAAGFPPFDDSTAVDLTLHMLQHVIIVMAGVLVAYPHLGRRLLKEGTGRLIPYLSLLACASFIVFWHLPAPWDAAVLNPLVHVVEHLSFLLVGILSGTWLLLLSDSGKIGALMSAFFGHMGYAVLLISPWNLQIYTLYSLSDQVILGWVLLLSGPLLLVGVAYVIARNPDWLGGFEASRPGNRARRETFLNKVIVPRRMPPAITLSLSAVMILYFALTGYAIGTAPVLLHGSTVYIADTPVSWQFAPQNITVVLGVNSTVTWVSHSISYDTVTGRGGSFGSGPIPPGGTFSHNFTAPGKYRYYCQYHPWMEGTVVVISG